LYHATHALPPHGRQTQGRSSGFTASEPADSISFIAWSDSSPIFEVASAPRLSDVLPPNLRTLTVRDDCWGYKNECERWEWNDVAYTKLFYGFLKHDRWREVCLKLQRINLRLDQTTDDDWEHERREKFKKMCDGKGLKCRIRKAVVDQEEVELWGGKEDQTEKREVELQTFFD
jgi:hypothetical protein